ncbi:MAG: macro domain-containing protein [Candidatus Hodarchaeales archaeon]
MIHNKFVYEIGKTKLFILRGDITTQKTDVLVNAANSQLIGGGGVDGAIHRAAGKYLMTELKKNYDFCSTGDLVVTSAGELSIQGIKRIFHAVGPIWNSGKSNESKLLASCDQKSINKLYELKMKTISFPAISTGVYGYPIKEASKIALDSVIKLIISKYRDEFDEIHFVLFSEADFKIYKKNFVEIIKKENRDL